MSNLLDVREGDAGHDQLRAALDAESLATLDLAEGGARYFGLQDDHGTFAAFGGLAGDGADLLLRSMVVQPAARRGGLGTRLVDLLESQARAQGASTLWLLTESAAPFFAHLGFAPAERAAAPPTIASSSQFRGLCPASAALMRKPLDGVAP